MIDRDIYLNLSTVVEQSNIPLWTEGIQKFH